MMRVIYNPVAGPKVVRKIDRIREVLSRKGIPFEVLSTAGPGDATTLSRDAALSGMDAVVAVGGDGTVNEAANGLAGSGTRLLVIPHGTGNVIAQEVGLPDTAEGCLDLLDSGKTVEIPLARANDRYFVLMASAGFDAEVVERMSAREKRALGIGAYLLAGTRHLFRSQPTLWLELPGRERMEVQAVLLCRGKRYARVVMDPAGNLLGDSLRMVALTRPGRWSLLRFTFSALRGTHLRSPAVLVREVTSVQARCRIPSAAQVDGDYLGPLPVRFEMTDVKLKVVVPAIFAPVDTSRGTGKEAWRSLGGADRFLRKERESRE